MPKNKKDSSDSDSGPEDRNPSKKSKSGKPEKSSDEENSWNLGKNRFLKLREYKGKHYVDIREFYDAGGELKPGKKGISLTLEQWQKLKGFMEELDDAIKNTV